MSRTSLMVVILPRPLSRDYSHAAPRPVALDREAPPGERAVQGGSGDDGAARVDPGAAAAGARGARPTRTTRLTALTPGTSTPRSSVKECDAPTRRSAPAGHVVGLRLPRADHGASPDADAYAVRDPITLAAAPDDPVAPASPDPVTGSERLSRLRPGAGRGCARRLGRPVPVRPRRGPRRRGAARAAHRGGLHPAGDLLVRRPVARLPVDAALRRDPRRARRLDARLGRLRRDGQGRRGGARPDTAARLDARRAVAGDRRRLHGAARPAGRCRRSASSQRS